MHKVQKPAHSRDNLQENTYVEVISLAAGVALWRGAHLLHVGLIEQRVRNEDHALHQAPQSSPVRALYLDIHCDNI